MHCCIVEEKHYDIVLYIKQFSVNDTKMDIRVLLANIQGFAQKFSSAWWGCCIRHAVVCNNFAPAFLPCASVVYSCGLKV